MRRLEGIIERGSGPPLVLVPGIQGRWEWMRHAVDALATRFRVLTFSLAGEPSSRAPLDPALGFDSFISQIDSVLDRTGVASATVCGVSFGGLIAYRYAALRPARVRQLVLASALPPDYRPDDHLDFYGRAPHLLAPLFLMGALRRGRVELWAAMPGMADRIRFAATAGWSAVRAPASPARMCDRLALLTRANLAATTRPDIPALVVTGDADLDKVVPVGLTERYLTLLPRAERATLERTGHNGILTRADAFASLVAEFHARHDTPAGPDGLEDGGSDATRAPS